ncbi:MAG: DUF177 domain-containing protein [Hyphomicrobiales bacterium]|nr:DUF177 domain-containing protein [Hyphomicrobiales bacterium]
MAKQRTSGAMRRGREEQAQGMPDATPDFMPRPYPVADLFDMDGDQLTIEADEAEKAEIAAAFELEKLANLRATLKVGVENKQLHVTGDVRARVTQICVVSLESFETDVTEPVDVYFSSDPSVLAAAATDVPGNESEWVDPPDAITGDTLDLGSLVLEHLALGLDPYPRKPGVTFQMDSGETEEDKPPSPFEALRALKDRT